MTDDTTTTPAPDAPSGAFTQADVDRIVGERLAREREKFADYDDLKEAAARAAEVQGQYEELLAASNATTSELRIERAARRHGLDDDLRAFLSGETDDEVDEQARTLAARLNAPADRGGPRPDPTQGQGGDMPLNGDPLLSALKSTLGIQ